MILFCSKELTVAVLDCVEETLCVSGTSSGGGGYGGSGGSQPLPIFSRSRLMADDELSLKGSDRVATGDLSVIKEQVESDCSRFVNADEDGRVKLGGLPGCALPAILVTRAVRRVDGCKEF